MDKLNIDIIEVSCQNEVKKASITNPYWPKALVTTFMKNRNKIHRIVLPLEQKKNIH